MDISIEKTSKIPYFSKNAIRNEEEHQKHHSYCFRIACTAIGIDGSRFNTKHHQLSFLGADYRLRDAGIYLEVAIF